MGASGVDVNTGSSANVQASEAMLGQLDMMNIRSNAARQAYGFDTQATSFENQAAIDKSAGKNAVTSGYILAGAKAASEAAAASQGGSFDGADLSAAETKDTSLLGSNYGPVYEQTPWDKYTQNSGF